MSRKLVYQRKNGTWEARFKKGLSENGKTVYGSVYGDTEEEAVARRIEVLGYDPDAPKFATELNLLILGAGSHGKDVMEIAESLRVFKKINFLDDKMLGERIIGKCKDILRFRSEYPCAFIAIGDCEKRKEYARLLKEMNFFIPTIVSHAANVSPKAVIGEGVAIMPQSTIGDAVIGNFCILASNSLVNSDSEVKEFSHVDCGGIVLRNSTVPEGTWINSGVIFGG